MSVLHRSSKTVQKRSSHRRRQHHKQAPAGGNGMGMTGLSTSAAGPLSAGQGYGPANAPERGQWRRLQLLQDHFAARSLFH